MNRNDPLDRTIVIKVSRKTHGDANVLKAELLKAADPKNPEKARKSLAALASLYRTLRG
jgi:hypothetical protein